MKYDLNKNWVYSIRFGQLNLKFPTQNHQNLKEFDSGDLNIDAYGGYKYGLEKWSRWFLIESSS